MNANTTRRVAILGIAASARTMTTTSATAMPAADAVAPSGSLRVAIAISPAPGPFWAGRDPVSSEPKGVTVDLGHGMADALGLPLKLVVYDNSGAITDAGDTGEWDITFVPADAARRQRLDFGPVYSQAESTFLVRPGVQISTVAEVNQSGIHVAGISNPTTIRAMAAWLSNTSAKGVPTVDAAIDQLKSGDIDAFGMSRDALIALSAAVPGSRVLSGHFFEISVAVALPKGRLAALEFATAFVENAKRSRLVRRIFDANGLHDQAVAP
jgi:polar amino acid transport system substrate-binding protein